MRVTHGHLQSKEGEDKGGRGREGEEKGKRRSRGKTIDEREEDVQEEGSGREPGDRAGGGGRVTCCRLDCILVKGSPRVNTTGVSLCPHFPPPLPPHYLHLLPS